MSEWAGTAWEGTTPPTDTGRNIARVAKASNSVYGPGAAFYGPGSAMATGGRESAARRVRAMKEAQALYHTNPWIGLAERTVSSKVSGLPWHLEHEDGTEMEDGAADPVGKMVRDLLEKPQANLPPEMRQVGILTGRNLRNITSRHAGLCGVSFWYLDQMDTDGWPLAILYLNPARVIPAQASGGRVVGWWLDAQDETGRGGTPLSLDEVLPFFLETPDWGYNPVGLVESAALKARITLQADLHSLYTLGTGGRIPGIVAPKEGYITDENLFNQLVNDFRQVNEAPDAAKRTTILRGPVDFIETGADPTELGLGDINSMNRDDIMAIWQVPPSQAGITGQRVGMNSGETRRWEKEILWTGPVHDRITILDETIQFGLLDRLPSQPQIVFEEPDFDDDAAPYQIAQTAEGTPLTVNERRDIVGEPPLPDYGPDGEPLGLAIIMPSKFSTWAQGAEENGKFNHAPEPEPEPETLPPPGAVPAGQPGPPSGLEVAKAGLGLRSVVDDEFIPVLEGKMRAFLARQRDDILSRLQAREPHLRAKPGDDSAWWRGDYWDRELAETLTPTLRRIAASVTTRAGQVLGAKADPFSDEVSRAVLDDVGRRVVGIDEYTRQQVADVIARSTLGDSWTIGQVIEAVRDMGVWNPSRAETIARTESGTTYNHATVASYRGYGVGQVTVLDGDRDDICATANGQVWSLEEAYDTPLGHPNCIRDFAPVF